MTGNIHGPGGVAVPGATIVIEDSKAGFRQESWSDVNGNYTFSNLPAGTYTLRVSLIGFREDVREPIPVSEGKTLKVNVALVISYGSPPPSTSSDNASAAGRQDGNLPSLSEGTQQRLLNIGGLTAAGGAVAGDSSANVRFSGESDTGPAQETASEEGIGSADMQVGAANSFLLSGSVAQAPLPGEGDHREELRDFRRGRGQDSAPGFGGEQGGGPGGRGGGFGGGGGGGFFIGGPFGGRRPQINRVHGNISDTYTNSAFDARDYPLNVTESPRIAAYTEQLGVGVGGPLTIPGIYHDKNKTSFFVNYRMTRGRSPFDSLSTVPSALNRQGGFSSICLSGFDASGICLDRDANGNVIHQLYDPASNSAGPRTPIANNQITSPIDGATQGLLNYFPPANLPGSIQNFRLQESLPAASDRVMVRIGHQLSDKDSLTAFYFLNSSRSHGVSSFPMLTRTASTLGQNVNLGETHSFGPRVMNNLIINFSRQRSSTLNAFAYRQNIASALGINEVSTDPRNWGLPTLSFTNFTGLNDTIPSLVRNQTFRAMDFLIINLGKHNLRLGGEIRRVVAQNWRDLHSEWGLS